MSADHPAPNSTAQSSAGAAPAINPAELYELADFERAARQVLTPIAWEYVTGGAADELTIRWNIEGFQRLRLRPRALIDVSALDTRIRLLGREHASPIILAPVAYQQLFHPEGELAAARGAAKGEATYVVSTSATKSVEAIRGASAGPLWFQLYVQRDRDHTLELVQRAEAAACEALVLTIDSPLLGPRYRELRTRFALPPGVVRAHHRAGAAATGSHRPSETNIYSAILDPTLTWKDVEWLRERTRLPVVVKGVLNPDDAARAVDLGVAGVIVSNHGGRNLDTVPATIDILPEVIARIGGCCPVLVDGGIRRGTDIMKAIALGATAVLVGRPYIHGLAVQGADGVARIVTMLRRELEMAMALAGRASVPEIDESLIWR